MAEIEITSQNFESEVIGSDIPVLLDFWATWCGPCRMLGPIISEIADDFDGKIKVGKVNVDDEQALAMKYGISSIPTVILFKDGKPNATSIGFLSKPDLIQTLGL